MENVELQVKELIIERYITLKKFCEKIDMPWTTLDSILKRGFANSNITNVMKISHELGLDTESLAIGILKETVTTIEHPKDIAAHFEGDEFTEEELTKIREFAAFVKANRK